MSDDKIQGYKDFLAEHVQIIEYELVENEMKPFIYEQEFSSTNSSQINQSVHVEYNRVKLTNVFSLIIKLTDSDNSQGLIQRTYNLDGEESRVYYNEITDELFTMYEETGNMIEAVYRVLDKFPGKEGLYNVPKFY